jgi:hypothetical protein
MQAGEYFFQTCDWCVMQHKEFTHPWYPPYLSSVRLPHGCTQALGEGIVHVSHLATHLGGGSLWTVTAHTNLFWWQQACHITGGCTQAARHVNDYCH